MESPPSSTPPSNSNSGSSRPRINLRDLPPNSFVDGIYSLLNPQIGSALTWGDFDGDGFDDAAIGVPNESVGSAAGAGAVHVAYGRNGSITPQGSQFWHQDRPGVKNAAEAGDHFGAAIIGGDFNGDGFDDLAIAAPDEDLGGDANAGAVNVLYGSNAGLRSAGNDLFHFDSPGVAGSTHLGDRFGAMLAAGDFNGDGFEDLLIGAPMKSVQNRTLAGAATLLYGSAEGLRGNGSQFWHQGVLSAGTLEPFDHFGLEMTVGDFNGDGFDDAAIAAPFETRGAARFAGGVNVIYGSVAGLAAGNDQFFDAQRVIGSQPRRDEHFGEALAAGDLNGDGFDELVVGVPTRTIMTLDAAGALSILHGSPTGIDTVNGYEFWHQSSLTFDEDFEAGDRFGAAVFCADFNGDGIDDLAVGVPGESIGLGGGAIAMTVGTPQGIEGNAGITWNQSSVGFAGTGSMGTSLPK